MSNRTPTIAAKPDAKLRTYVYAQTGDKKHSKSVTVFNATPDEVIGWVRDGVESKQREQQQPQRAAGGD